MRKFLWQFLFVDQTTKELSSSKFWFHAGTATAIFISIYAVVKQVEVPDAVVYLVIGVITNRMGRKLWEKHKDAAAGKGE